MKFFAAAAVASFIGVVAAVAEPDTTVYSTHVVTITSCPPEVPVCPGRTHTSYIPVTTPAPVVPTTYANSTTPCPSETKPPVQTTVVPVCPGEEICHPPPVCPGGESCPHPVASTGVIVPPANTSVPVVPTTPPFEESSATKIGASVAAMAGAAVLAMLL